MKKIIIIGYYDHANAGDEQYKDTFNYLINKILIHDMNGVDSTTVDTAIDTTGNKDEKCEIVFLDCDKLYDYYNNGNISRSDIVIVGGGDVLNNYFLDKIIHVFNNKSNNIYAISVGIPYKSIITSGKLNIFNAIYIRSFQDLYTLKEYHNNVYYIPDVSCLTRRIMSNSSTYGDYDSTINMTNEGILIYKNLRNIKNKKVCLSLSRHIYNSNHNEYYNNIISKFSEFIKHLILNSYHVVLLPFNTNSTNNNENDLIIHNDVFNKLSYVGDISTDRYTSCITNIQSRCNEYDIYKIYKTCHVIIPMRFHSCLYSIYSYVPFLPVYTTRKINNLLLDCSWNFGYKLTTTTTDIPTDLNLEILILRFNMLIDDYYNCITQLQRINSDITELSNKYKNIKIQSNICIDGENTDTTSKILIKSVTNIDKIQLIISKVKEYIIGITSNTDNTEGNTGNDLELFKIKDVKTRNIIVQMVSYYLTDGNTDSVYNYGLHQKMFKNDYNIYSEWSWILQDLSLGDEETKKKKLKSNPDGLFNINYIDQHDYSGVHRSGWHYVYEKISFLHNESSSLFLDLYLDRTFHWNNDINKILGIIPYKQLWCGFIHHTFDTEFSDYNCVELFKNVNFIESLQYCKGLFVLSNTLRDKIVIELNKLSSSLNNSKHTIYTPPVLSYIHPTETDVKCFTLDNFKNNNDKKLIHIGGWLRHVYNFYKLTIPETILMRNSFNIYEKYILHRKKVDTIKKVALKGKNMNNYFPNDSLLTDLQSLFINYQNDHNDTNGESSSSSTNSNISTNGNVSSHGNSNGNVSSNGNSNIVSDKNILNNWHKHFYQDMTNIFNSVEIIYYMDNQSYDTLLSENIIFLNLVDASAVNTLIECIVRNTPIVINKIPAVVELLGKNYPLYYDNIDEVYNLINERNIINAYKYLVNIDKKKFTITYFTSYFINDLRLINST